MWTVLPSRSTTSVSRWDGYTLIASILRRPTFRGPATAVRVVRGLSLLDNYRDGTVISTLCGPVRTVVSRKDDVENMFLICHGFAVDDTELHSLFSIGGQQE